MSALNISLSIGGAILAAGFIWLIWRIGAGLVQSGRDKQKAEQDQGELKERKDADDTMEKAAEDYAKKGGAKGALGRGDF